MARPGAALWLFVCSAFAVATRKRWSVPPAIAHALMDGAGVLIGVLLPLLRA